MNKCNNYQDSFTRKEWLQTWNTNCSNFCCELVMSFEHLWYISIFFIIHPGLWCPLRNEFNDHLTAKMHGKKWSNAYLTMYTQYKIGDARAAGNFQRVTKFFPKIPYTKCTLVLSWGRGYLPLLHAPECGPATLLFAFPHITTPVKLSSLPAQRA